MAGSNPIIDILSYPTAKAVLAGIAAMVVKRVMQGSAKNGWVASDLCSELLARELEADVFIRATEADAVFVDWGKRQRRHLGKLARRRHANTAFL